MTGRMQKTHCIHVCNDAQERAHAGIHELQVGNFENHKLERACALPDTPWFIRMHTHGGQVRGCAVLGDDHDDDAGLWGHIPRHALRTHLRRLCGPYQHARFLLLHGKCRGSYLPGTHSRGKDVTRALAFFICGSACLCARSLDCVSDISVRAFVREFSRFQAWRTGIKTSSEP